MWRYLCAFLILNISRGLENAWSYHPSACEDEWMQPPKRDTICQTAAKFEQIEAAKIWLSYSKAAFLQPHSLIAPTSSQNRSLSFMVNTRSGHSEPIEPLHGMGRHPFANVGCFYPRKRNKQAVIPKEMHQASIPITSLMDISYLVLQNHCTEAPQTNSQSKNVFFDLGASVGFKGYELSHGIPTKTPTTGSNIGGSLPLFYKLYADRCQEFDEIYAWEVTQTSPSEWWGQLPAHIRAKVHYYNVPVNETNQINGAPNPSSFLHLLAAAVTEEDNVIVKVDIDTPEVEFNIMSTIAHNAHFTTLIDEIFFEYHYYFDGLNFGWGRYDNQSESGGLSHDVDSALYLFRTLREKGIRAHFWI